MVWEDITSVNTLGISEASCVQIVSQGNESEEMQKNMGSLDVPKFRVLDAVGITEQPGAAQNGRGSVGAEGVKLPKINDATHGVRNTAIRRALVTGRSRSLESDW